MRRWERPRDETRRGVGLALGSGRSLDEIAQSKERNGMQQHACPN